MRRALALCVVLALTLAWPGAASNAPDDCGTGMDAPGEPFTGVAVALPLDCTGALIERLEDDWDIYSVTFTEGPVYARLEPPAGADFDLCIVEPSWSSAACSQTSGIEDLSIWWPAGPAYVAVIGVAGEGTYRLSVAQQDDCGTGIDALWEPAAKLASAYARCDALLDVFEGDHEDAFIVPPPPTPDVVIVRIEPSTWSYRICVDDEARQLGVRGRCTDSTFSRVVVARDTLREMRVTVEGFSVEPFPYKLIVEDATQHPPQVPPLL